MIILDTNVISELLRPSPEPKVEVWLAAQKSSAVFLTTINEAELRYGVAIKAAGKRRNQLKSAIEAILREDFAERILSFDRPAAEAYAIIGAERRKSGRPMNQFDCQIAAIARSRGAVLATHNTKDFRNCGITLVDPWAHTSVLN